MNSSSISLLRGMGTALLLAMVPALSAQEAAVKLAKQIFTEVNAAKGLKQLSKQSEDADGYPLDAKIWEAEDRVIRKMQTVRSEEHGSETTDYYYTADGDLVFAFQVITTEHIETGKVVNKVEHRYYSMPPAAAWCNGSMRTRNR